MRKIPVLLYLLLGIACAPAPSTDTLTHWDMRQEGSSRSYPVEVPVTVAGALYEAGCLGNGILEGLRYQKADKSVFDTPWIFTTHFSAPEGMHHILRFESLGYSADISLNGNLLASADTTVGVFCVREFDVSRFIGRKNTLEVRVHKAPDASLNHGWVDWNPRPLDETMGILGPVRLISTPDVQVQDVFVEPVVDLKDFSSAHLKIVIKLVNRSQIPVTGIVKGKAEGISFEIPVTLDASETRVLNHTETVVNPRIWWSAEMGSPELYHLRVSFGESHSKNVRFGIRDIRSELTAEGHRQFILNGKPVLVKGAGWTDDIFMMDTPQSISRQVQMVKDMGLNCIRFENVWGKDDTVYDLCDSLGILTLMGFSCQWEWDHYCGLPQTPSHGCIEGEPWESLAVRYFHDQLIRLRNHPSLIGWFSGSDRDPNERLESAYLEVYNQLDYRPYICSANGITSQVSGPSGMKMAGPYEYVGPGYWYEDTRNGGAFGFNTETNPGMNIPQKESVLRMLGGEEAWPLGPAWNYHCTASATNMNSVEPEVAAAEGTYGPLKSFEDFVQKAHALDYDSTRAMYEAFRVNIGTATGIVNWMLNSAWPSLYWQLYDWYGVPTAGYYGVKHACEPVQLVYNYATREIVAVNDAAAQAAFHTQILFYGTDSKPVLRREYDVVSSPREPVILEKLPRDTPGFLSLVLKDDKGETVARNFYCVPAENTQHDWANAEWWGIPILSYADLSFVGNLAGADVRLETSPAEGGTLVTLINTSEGVSFQNILKAVRADGTLAPGPVWEDNFISLLPGETRTVLCRAQDVTITCEAWKP